MFSPDRFGDVGKNFCDPEAGSSGRQYVALKTAFSPKGRKAKGGSYTPGGILPSKNKRSSLQKAAQFRFSEPSTPSVLKDRGLRPSDLSDPHKKDFLTQLTTRIFHLSLVNKLAILLFVFWHGMKVSRPHPLLRADSFYLCTFAHMDASKVCNSFFLYITHDALILIQNKQLHLMKKCTKNINIIINTKINHFKLKGRQVGGEMRTFEKLTS